MLRSNTDNGSKIRVYCRDTTNSYLAFIIRYLFFILGFRIFIVVKITILIDTE